MKKRDKPNREPKPRGPSRQRQAALSNWDNEGGALPAGPQPGSTPGDGAFAALPVTGVDLAQLRMRVIALEHLVITLLAQGSHGQLDVARGMAAYIAPRPGFTRHPLTIQAAAQMIHLVERAEHFQSAAQRE